MKRRQTRIYADIYSKLNLFNKSVSDSPEATEASDAFRTESIFASTLGSSKPPILQNRRTCLIRTSSSMFGGCCCMYCTGQEAFVHCNSVMGETYALRFICRFELMIFFFPFLNFKEWYVGIDLLTAAADAIQGQKLIQGMRERQN